MHINSTFSTIVDMSSGLFPANGTIHWLPPEIIFINLTPLIPLSMIGISSLHEGEGLFLKGLRPFDLPLAKKLSLYSITHIT